MFNPIPLPESLKRKASVYHKQKAQNNHNQRQAQFKQDMEKIKDMQKHYANFQKRKLHNIRNRILPDYVKYDSEGQRIWE